MAVSPKDLCQFLLHKDRPDLESAQLNVCRHACMCVHCIVGSVLDLTHVISEYLCISIRHIYRCIIDVC